jgi:hypothetical protein
MLTAKQLRRVLRHKQSYDKNFMRPNMSNKVVTKSDWPEPERCPYHSRAYGGRCELPAGHDTKDGCVSAGDGFRSGWNPYTETESDDV